MTAQQLAAVITAAAGLITAVVALIRALRTHTVVKAHVRGHAENAWAARPGPPRP